MQVLCLLTAALSTVHNAAAGKHRAPATDISATKEFVVAHVRWSSLQPTSLRDARSDAWWQTFVVSARALRQADKKECVSIVQCVLALLTVLRLTREERTWR